MMERDFTLVDAAQSYARIWHRDQPYGDQPYLSGHLYPVVCTISEYDDSLEMICAGWMHDGPEDAGSPFRRHARETLIKAEFGDVVHGLVWAVTGVGDNRKARNADAYRKIAVTPRAPIVKACDRLINARTSQELRTSQHEMYRKEYPGFRELVADHIPIDLLHRLDAAHEKIVG